MENQLGPFVFFRGVCVQSTLDIFQRKSFRMLLEGNPKQLQHNFLALAGPDGSKWVGQNGCRWVKVFLNESKLV